jgi:prephenate dehydratase
VGYTAKTDYCQVLYERNYGISKMTTDLPQTIGQPQPDLRELKVAIQGAAGSFSEAAALTLFPKAIIVYKPNFNDAFAATNTGEADVAVIPVDNSLAGRVNDVHRLIPQFSLAITGEYIMPISHNLLAVKGTKIENITTIFSHIHALPQCQNLISELGAKGMERGDTAASARFVSEQNNGQYAAIASKKAAALYGLEILKEDIQDNLKNSTRFLTLTRKNTPLHESMKPAYDPKKDYVTGLLFSLDDNSGTLYNAIGAFAQRDINILKLESYQHEDHGVAGFFCEISGHPDSEILGAALQQLSENAGYVNVLGSYEADITRTQQKALPKPNAPLK